jgi:membrane-associated HD superfamily phosphohydrolase
MSIVIWLVCGPVFHFSENWQLVVNTGMTVITFLMVFLIQQRQNKDSVAVHLKLNELLASQKLHCLRIASMKTFPRVPELFKLSLPLAAMEILVVATVAIDTALCTPDASTDSNRLAACANGVLRTDRNSLSELMR